MMLSWVAFWYLKFHLLLLYKNRTNLCILTFNSVPTLNSLIRVNNCFIYFSIFYIHNRVSAVIEAYLYLLNILTLNNTIYCITTLTVISNIISNKNESEYSFFLDSCLSAKF